MRNKWRRSKYKERKKERTDEIYEKKKGEKEWNGKQGNKVKLGQRKMRKRKFRGEAISIKKNKKKLKEERKKGKYR